MSVGTRVYTNVDGLSKSYLTTGAFPTSAIAGQLAVATDTDKLYIFDADTSTWVEVGSVGGSSSFRVETRTLSALEATNKQITLTQVPGGLSQILVSVVGGTAQMVTTDYSVASNVLSWGGLSLDGLLSTGDTLIITYSF